MTRHKVEPKSIGEREDALAELNEFILNHIRYEDNFVVIRMVVSQQTPMNTEKELKPSSSQALFRKITESFRKSVRSEDYVGKLSIDEYIIIIKDNNPANGSLVANRLSRIVSDTTNGTFIGRTYVTAYQEGDTPQDILERVMH
ncbi:MAG: diguanylate cyclase [Succinivibrionaceae bacterium]|nr:diguanylate cyclase [Succinivibrionaceae bacterium]